MTEAELRDELMTLLFAGHETTATALAWALDRILADGAIEARLRAELHESGSGGGGEALDAGALARLPYLDAVVKETLRIRPVLPIIARQTQAPFQLAGVELPAGVRIAPCVYLAQRRAASFPEPDAFRPERFLDGKADPYAWLPFGGGIRRCLGMAFALYEMKVVLATVLRNTRLRRAPGATARMVRRTVTLVPSDGTRVVLDERRPGA
jgi:cytochrome P450